MNISIDKSTWDKVKFGDVVDNTNETIKNPVDSGIDKFIGLDHLESGDLRIKRFGNTLDGVTFTKLVLPGQTLFGKRRSYQRKVAFADFKAVCSGDILAFSAKPGLILDTYLPFVVSSDSFFAKAIATSAGSLSPRTRWSDLAKFEFLLPPIDIQTEIAKLFWAIESQLEAIEKLTAQLSKTLNSYMNEVVWDSSIGRVELRNMSPDVTILDGDWIESDDMDENGDIRLLQLSDIGIGYFKDNSSKWINESAAKRINVNYLKPNDILISRMADPIGRSCLLPDLGTKCITAVDVAILRLSNEYANLPELVTLLNSQRWTDEVLRLSRGTTRTRITRKDLEKIQIPNLFLDSNEPIVGTLKKLNESLEAIRVETNGLIDLKTTLLNEFLG
jgi:type I restriction enzyme S subunit